MDQGFPILDFLGKGMTWNSKVISGRIFFLFVPQESDIPLQTGVRTEDPKQHRNCELQVHFTPFQWRVQSLILSVDP